VARLAAIAWNLVLLLVSLLLLAGLYLAGRATWRALSTGTPLPGSDGAGAGASSSVVSSGTGAGAGPGGLSTGGGGASAFDPKEYKKDELPETSLKTFADVKGCDESKAELQVGVVVVVAVRGASWLQVCKRTPVVACSALHGHPCCQL
jgi:ATP-dependent metalloprotease